MESSRLRSIQIEGQDLITGTGRTKDRQTFLIGGLLVLWTFLTTIRGQVI